MEKETKILEINLISAQNLKIPSTKLRGIQTYAVAWIDPTAKLRSRIDRIGGANPTWNEKFVFRVSPGFIHGDTSAVTVKIYAAAYVRDVLVGSVRFLLSSCLSSKSGASIGTPAFTAVQIRRSSGAFHGVLNIAATVYESSDFAAMTGLSAVCFRDLIGEGEERRRHRDRRLSLGGSERSELSSGGESCDFDSAVDFSDDTESSTSSSSSNTVTAFKDWNEKVAGKKEASKSDGGGLLCGLMLHRRFSLGPLDENFQAFAGLQGRKR